MEELAVCLSLRMRRLALALQPRGRTNLHADVYVSITARKLLHADKRMGFLSQLPQYGRAKCAMPL